MQENFVDSLLATVWSIITTTTSAFFAFVYNLDLKYGHQTAGFILVVLGFLISIVLSRRSFYRRNFAGLEGFSSFSTAILVTSIEGVVGLFGFGCMMSGLWLLARHYFASQ